MILRFAEEITLLMLGDEDGEFVSLPGWSVQCAYAGAVLMDLALENRIDSDPEIARPHRSGFPSGRSARPDPRPDRAGGGNVRPPPLGRAHRRRRRSHPRTRTRQPRRARHPAARGRPASFGCSDHDATRSSTARPSGEVKLRIMAVLFGDEIPDPRDVVIICLADRLRHLPGDSCRSGAGTCVRAYRSGAQAGPDRSGGLEGCLGHPGVDRPCDAPDVLKRSGKFRNRRHATHAACSRRREPSGHRTQSEDGAMPFFRSSSIAWSRLPRCPSPMPRRTWSALVNWMLV